MERAVQNSQDEEYENLDPHISVMFVDTDTECLRGR